VKEARRGRLGKKKGAQDLGGQSKNRPKGNGPVWGEGRGWGVFGKSKFSFGGHAMMSKRRKKRKKEFSSSGGSGGGKSTRKSERGGKEFLLSEDQTQKRQFTTDQRGLEGKREVGLLTTGTKHRKKTHDPLSAETTARPI